MTDQNNTAIAAPDDAEGVFLIWPGDGVPPDTRHWQVREQMSDFGGQRIVRNVYSPSLTKFAPRGDTVTGASVIVLPGGAFHMLAIDNEGYDVARWFAARGVTAFVLRYRLQPTPSDEGELPGFFEKLFPQLPKVEQTTEDPPQSFDKTEEARLWAEADAQQAMLFVREHSGELGIDAGRIGMIGFSAGGVCVNVAASEAKNVRPDFVAGIYPGWRLPLEVPKDAPPLFIASGDQDRFVAPISGARLYEAWHKAGADAELHIFGGSEHGFGMAPQNRPTDAWLGLLEIWLKRLSVIA